MTGSGRYYLDKMTNLLILWICEFSHPLPKIGGDREHGRSKTVNDSNPMATLHNANVVGMHVSQDIIDEDNPVLSSLLPCSYSE